MHALLVSVLLAADPLTVLWPRVIPHSAAEGSTEVGTQLQTRLVEMARRVFPGRELDVRPKGERSCPEKGCSGGSLGVLLIRSGDDGCAVIVLAGKPGRSGVHLTPWQGKLDLKKTDIDFRDPPESQVTIRDYARCSELQKTTAAPNADAERSLRDTAK
jgi:hypothetical protein